MSGSMIPVVSGPPAAVIADADKVDARRFMGYPAYGAGNAGFQSWRYFSTYGLLEFRLNNLTAQEASVLHMHLVNCRSLETAVVSAGDRLSTASAASWTRNQTEVADRDALLEREGRRVAAFLEVPYGPGRETRGTRRIIV